MEKGGPALAPRPPPPPSIRGDSFSIGALEGNKMPGLARLGILSGQGHRVKTSGENFTARGATPPLWRPVLPAASCLTLFLPGLACGWFKILAGRPLPSFSRPLIKLKVQRRVVT